MGGPTGYGGVRRQWSAASVMAARQEGAAAASDGARASLVAVDPAASGADGPADSKGARKRGSSTAEYFAVWHWSSEIHCKWCRV